MQPRDITGRYLVSVAIALSNEKLKDSIAIRLNHQPSDGLGM